MYMPKKNWDFLRSPGYALIWVCSDPDGETSVTTHRRYTDGVKAHKPNLRLRTHHSSEPRAKGILEKYAKINVLFCL